MEITAKEILELIESGLKAIETQKKKAAPLMQSYLTGYAEGYISLKQLILERQQGKK